MGNDPPTLNYLNGYVGNTAKTYKLRVGSKYKLCAKANYLQQVS